jgi:uncharacterized membrane protein
MTETTLQGFRDIAELMCCGGRWEWIGLHLYQRMVHLAEKRAKDYAQRYGGVARPMADK